LLSDRRRTTAGERLYKMPAVLAALVALLSACSSESLPEPEPEVFHAGAFFAVGDSELALYRTLKALRIEGDTILFTTLYDVVPANFDEAREMAKRPSLPIRQELVSASEVLLLRQSVRVVWFRTLTKAEENRSP
jgi:hypothetical protein